MPIKTSRDVDRIPAPAPEEPDEFSPEQLAAFRAVLKCMSLLPPRIGLALLRCVWISDGTPSAETIAETAGVSRQAVSQALARARRRSGLHAGSVRELMAALRASRADLDAESEGDFA
jgi:DNA-directed RNA polymerase specialized sigma24 family protein